MEKEEISISILGTFLDINELCLKLVQKNKCRLQISKQYDLSPINVYVLRNEEA